MIPESTSVWQQTEFSLSPRANGTHLITEEVLSNTQKLLDQFQMGILHLFLKHTSAAITINENCDPSVRDDFSMAVERLIPRTYPYVHTTEGSDDMPAHLKSSFIGVQLSIPFKQAGQRTQLNLGTWQGIYLCEFRDRPHKRQICATVFGSPKENRGSK